MPQNSPFTIQLNSEFLKERQHLIWQARDLAAAYAEKDVIFDEPLREMGEALWQSISVYLPHLTTQFDAAKERLETSPLPVIIESNDATVFNLPWETLYHPFYGFLGRESGFSLSRRIASLHSVLPPVEKGPLRVLIFTSLPDDLEENGRLNIEAEQAAIQESLSRLEQTGQVHIEMPDDGRFDTFQRLLQTFKPHLVYLSGHGQLEHDLVNDKTYATFLFEDEWGVSLAKTQADIAACFTNTGVQAVILSACQSGKQSSNDLNTGLSLSLAQCGIPHVIGIRESVLDVAGTRFAHAFFDALGEQKTIPMALQLARAAIIRPLADLETEEGPRLTEVSLGQWCLPMLISQQHDHALIDWQFEAQPKAILSTNNLTFQKIHLPVQFVGRRRELRQLQNRLRAKASQPINQLWLIGAGGMGKTALMGKLAKGLENDGYAVYAYTAITGQRLSDFELNVALTLSKNHAEEFDRARRSDPLTRITLLLQFLLTEHNNKVVLFFDNLESVQAPQAPHTITDPEMQAWLQAAQTLVGRGLILLATSRWQLADWQNTSERLCHPLQKPIYGDFIAFARHLYQAQKLPAKFVSNPTKMRRAYTMLGGNFRALTFFANAVLTMQRSDEAAFVAALAKAQTDAQTDIALAQVWQQRSHAEQTVLNALLAYDEPIPLDGIRVLDDDLQTCKPVLRQLVNVSLVEQSYNPDFDCSEYVLSSILRDWMAKQSTFVLPPPQILDHAADYQHWLLEYERGNLTQAIITHKALHKTGRIEQAHALVLDKIVLPLHRAGQYQALLEGWLLDTQTSQDPKLRGESLQRIGEQLFCLGNYQEALNFYKQSLNIRQRIGDKQGESESLNNISTIYYIYGDHDAAITHINQSLATRQEIGDKKGEGESLNSLSIIYFARGDYETALFYIKQSLTIKQQIGDREGNGIVLNNIGEIYRFRGDYETARSYFNQSLDIQQQLGVKRGKSTSLTSISAIYVERGDYETALSYLNQSLDIQQQIGAKLDESICLSNIGVIYYMRNDHETALSYYNQSLDIQQQIGAKLNESINLNNIGQIYRFRGDYETALSYYNQSLDIQQQIGEKLNEGITLNNIGQIYHIRGDNDTALNYFNRSLNINQQIGNKAGEGESLNDIGTIYRIRGDNDTALNYFNRSLNINQQIGNKAGEGKSLNDIGTIYRIRGDNDTALNYFNRSLNIRQQIGHKAGEGSSLNDIGEIYRIRGDNDTALNYFNRSLNIRQQIGNKANEGGSLNNIALIYHARGDNDTSLTYLKLALEVHQQTGDMTQLCVTLFNIGVIYWQNGKRNKALREWLTAYTLASKIQFAEALSILEKLAKKLNLPNGLDGWATMADQFERTEQLPTFGWFLKRWLLGRLAALFGH